MNLAVIAILMPTAVNFTSSGISEVILQNLSIAVAIVLILVYGLTLLFSMKTHSYLYDVGLVETDQVELAEANLIGGETGVNLWLWVGVLLGATLLVAVESELLVESLEVATAQLGLTSLFTGVILVPIIGNAAEHATAVTVAMKDKMDLSVSVAVGSSLQIALFVAPVLVIAGWFMGKPMDLNFNAVEAQTIIARTYALRNVRRFAIDGYELSADVHCQVYKGLSGASPNSDRAISATKGQVLTYQNQLVDALYSSTTGGVTAKFSDVWNGEDRPYLKPVVDAAGSIWNLARQSLADEQNFQQFININRGFNEVGWKTFRWRRESSMEQLTKDLQKYLEVNRSPYASFQKLQGLQVVERSPGGRILKLSVQTDIGTFNLLKDEVRSAFSAPRSTLFYLQPVKKDNNPLWGYAFVGGGFGHGVGLSQTGAYRLAELGWTSKRILSFYYPGTTIRVMDSKVKP